MIAGSNIDARYWGKAAAFSDQRPDYHLLAFHCIDVAAVGSALLRRMPRLRGLLAGLFGTEERYADAWLTYLISLHDLGKFAEAFQGQKPELFERLNRRQPARTYSVRHDSLGNGLWTAELMSDVLTQDFGLPKRWKHFFAPLIRAVTGHHGQPPQSVGHIGDHFSRADIDAARAFAKEMQALLVPADAIEALAAQDGDDSIEHRVAALSWWLAGLTVLADWLGSNAAYFPYRDDASTSIDDYWHYAVKQAAIALHQTGVLPQAVLHGQVMVDLFPHLVDESGRFKPTPLQHWAESVPLPAGPQLYLLEDVTGAGKTEAAITLAYRLMEAGEADGAFIGLPTMATANAMFRRLQMTARRLYQPDARPSLMLAHAQRQLSSSFRESVVVLPDDVAEGDLKQRDETASARCAAWLADHNKKALLASAGVGTIDQALMAVLHSKHQSLRLLGLVGKVLVVDEVHACDAYMQAVLEQLLRFHAAGGGSAILLSATLPAAMKQKLAEAWSAGRGMPPAELSEGAYPLAARIGHAPLLEKPLDTRPEVQRRVRTECESDPSRIQVRIRAALAAGHCVVWVRNTVFDVLAAREWFADLSDDQVLLFHARYAMGDRLRIEQQVMDSFGPRSRASQRHGRLVIGSQVIEMSLDCDFDLMVSDLAPIDRLIQRAGRLHRHARDADGNPGGSDDQRGDPLLIVHTPAWTESPDDGWFKAPFPKAQYVYPHHGQLWLTARWLQTGSYTMPGDARKMIEGVFSDAAQDDIPVGLRNASNRAEGQDDASRSIGRQSSLKFENGYSVGDAIDWWREASTPTRLGEASIDLRLMVWNGSRLHPWFDHVDDALAYSTVRVPLKHFPLDAEPLDAAQRDALKSFKDGLKDKGKWAGWLVLVDDGGGGFVGSSIDDKNRSQRWRYDAKCGLRREAQ